MSLSTKSMQFTTDLEGSITGVIMRLSANHRKAAQLRGVIPDSAFLYSFKRNWFYRIPLAHVECARNVGLTIARKS